MTMQVQGPNGVTVEFPDGTDPQTIDNVMREAVSKAAGQQVRGELSAMTPSVPVGGNADQGSATSAAANLLTFDLQPKINAAGIAAIEALRGKGFQDTYNKVLEQQRGNQAAYERKNPIKTKLAQAGGLAGGVAMLPSIGSGLSGALATGSIYGGASGAAQDANSMQERLQNTATGIVGGFGTGGLLYPVSKGIGAGLSKLLGGGKAPLPTTEDLDDTVRSAYSAAESGPGKVRMTRTHMEKLARAFNEVGQETKRGSVLSGVTPDLYKSTNTIIDNFNGAAGDVIAGRAPPPTFGELEKMRQDLNFAYRQSVLPDGKISADGNKIASLVDKIDEQMLLTPFKEARAAYVTKLKADKIDRAFFVAEINAGSRYTQAGMEKAVQEQFAKLAKDKNFHRLFNETEQQMILDVAKTGGWQKMMKIVGSAAPRGGLSTWLNMMLGVAAPHVGIPLTLTSEAAKRGSTAITMSKANAVNEMIRGGGKQGGLLEVDQVNRVLLPGAGLLGSQLWKQYAPNR